jgi:hypothetical protein
LTIPLLRGIARLLSLLSSWFNKALGEKMIEHLSKFTEADKITSLQLWKLGDEPEVAASVMDLFALLPQASRFVEALVKSTLRLAVFFGTCDCHLFGFKLLILLSFFQILKAGGCLVPTRFTIQRPSSTLPESPLCK